MDEQNPPLVSMITPCYNGERFVKRFLDSVFEQTYNNIEFIFINDGSTDQTEDIVLSYQNKLEERGIKLIYIYQENAGQSNAINKGLKIFRGDYLIWPDSDDILDKNNIKHKVDLLEEHPEFGFVLCKTRLYAEGNLEQQIGSLQRIPPKGNDNLFHDLIVEHNVYFAPGGYMVRASAFLNVNPSRRIYDELPGQNYQLLLPIAYQYQCGYLNEFLYSYIMRDDSHSRKDKGKEKLIDNTYLHMKLLGTVIQEMHIPEEEYYLNLIKYKYIRRRLILAFEYNDKMIVAEQYHQLKADKKATPYDTLIYYRSRNIILDTIIRIFGKLKRSILSYSAK